jgi:ABC-type protease/lipase transport system fused ATPase/permease subunit
VAQNIARFREADHAGIICAARLAGVHEMVQQMPNGYNTEIGDSGQSLSGGQRQRIGLARALFGNPSVVVLDEPNANLDAAGDTALTEAVRHLKAGGTTVVFVTHKTNMLQLADQVLLMDQGTVRLYGERDEVMAQIFSGPKVVPTSPHPHVAAVPTPTVQAPAAAS